MVINSSSVSVRLTAMLAYFKKVKNLKRLNVSVKENGDACYTDGETITIGLKFSLFGDAVNVNEKFALLAGAAFHELGHVLYTPFRILIRAKRYVHEGLFWPKNPAGCSALSAYAAKNEKQAGRVYSAYANLVNILEDPRIEYLMLTCNGRYGIFCSGLRLLRMKMESRQEPFSFTIQKLSEVPEENRAEANFAVLYDLILYYARFGKIKGVKKEEYSEPIAVKMLEIADMISDATKAVTAEEFFDCTNRIFVACFDDYLLPYFESIDEDEEKIGENGNADGVNGSSAVEKALNNVKSISQGDIRQSGIAKADVERAAQNEKLKAARDLKESQSNQEEKDAEKEIHGQNTLIERKETTEITGGETGGLEIQERDLERIKELDLSAIETIEANKGTAAVRDYDESLKAPDLDYGKAHDGVKIIVRRNSISGKHDAEYESYKRFISLGQRTGNLIKPLLQKENNVKWQENRFYGTRFSASKAANPNLRHFGKKVLKRRTPVVAFGILVDCSGSMYGNKIEMARAMAITCYEACKAAEIDFGVFGHHTEGMDVIVDNYVYFDEKESEAKYRLLSIDASGSNRDGAALKYVAEKLSEVNADRKILIVISDGQPAHRGYVGTAAEEDIRRIVKEYKAKNVSFIAAAIDEDKERIKGIYGKERFLAIDVPEKIPEEILKLIKRAIFA